MEPQSEAGKQLYACLEAHPKLALKIAYAVVEGLFLDEEDGHMLPEDDSYPRGSGSDFVDHVGQEVMLDDTSGLPELISKLQSEVEEDG